MELKNDIQLKGILKSVDQYLNIKLDDIQVVEELKYPHLVWESAAPSSSAENAWLTSLFSYIELCKERFHSWICRSICPPASGVSRYPAARGCHTERQVSWKVELIYLDEG